MPRLRLAHRRFRTWLRPLVAALTLVALTVCTLGIPLPLANQKPATEPYPCMDCPCGCKDAETCWSNCCCHTLQEKLAWAEEHGVTPPDYVLAAAARAGATAKPTCCGGRACCASAQKERTSCCSDRRVCERPAPSATRTATTVLMIHALKCQGLTPTLTLVPPTVLTLPIEPAFFATPAGVCRVADDLLATGQAPAPDTPPPQAV